MSMNPTTYQKPTGKIESNFKVGTQMGRIVQVLNVGEQHQTMWNDKTKQMQKLYWLPKEEQTKEKKQTVQENDNPVTSVLFKITVEFPNVRSKNEQGEDIGPAWLSKDFGAKSRALAALMESFEKTNLGAIAGEAVMCPIGFTSGGKPKMTSIAAAPEGVPVPEIEHKEKIVVFDFYEPDMEVYEKLYDWQKDVLKQAVDFPGSKLEKMMSTSGSGTQNEPSSQGFDDWEDEFPPFTAGA